MFDLDPQLYRQGRRRLRQLLPAVLAEAGRADFETVSASGLAGAMAPYLRSDNLDALLIRPSPLGGWHADLLLKEAPPGVSNVIGTPSPAPMASKAEAEQAGRVLLLYALTVERQALDQAARRGPVFLLRGVAIPLFPELMRRMQAQAPLDAELPRTPERIAALLDDYLERPLVRGLAIRQWPPEQRRKLVFVLNWAAVHGVLRHPPSEDAPPGPHASAAGTVH